MKFAPMAASSALHNSVNLLLKGGPCQTRPSPHYNLGHHESAMKNLHLTVLAFAGALALALAIPAAHAANFTYTLTGTGSGSLGDTAFADRAFAIVGVGDPATIADCAVADCRYVDFSSTLVRIQGLGDFAVSSALRVFNTLGNLGLSRGGAGGLDLYNAFTVPVDYDFAASIGPIPAFASLLQWSSEEVLTSGGVLVFNNGDANGTFSAEGVPLPSAVWLLGSALVVGGLRRRRSV